MYSENFVIHAFEKAHDLIEMQKKYELNNLAKGRELLRKWITI